jgi:hypothetical protein
MVLEGDLRKLKEMLEDLECERVLNPLPAAAEKSYAFLDWKIFYPPSMHEFSGFLRSLRLKI